MMNEFSLVVVAKANQRCAADRRPWLTPETQSIFREFVRRGGGLLIVHGGACYKDLPEMRGVAGGAFLRHPEQCAVTIEPQAGSPLTADVRPFTVFDEHYEMALDAPDAEVFLRSRSEHGVQPAGWTRTEGDGRVCVLTPGHNLEVWLHPGFQAILRHALKWCAKLN
jgi:type 1 glutamine amidotransferase